MRRILIGLLFLAAGGGAFGASADDLVVARPGNLPIVLTAPHGGDLAVPGARVRTAGTMVRDAHTFELAEALAKRLNELLGADPYVVAARFSRRYIDANRYERDAFEDPAARPVYEAYHKSVRGYVDEVRKRFPGGALLIDIHGQGTDPDTVHRGTSNGATVADLVRRHGSEALIGEKSIFGVLRSKGRTVFPPNTPIGSPPENPAYNGGPTVQMYGSNKAGGIDAIQLELGMNLRRTPEFVNDLAEAVAVHYRTYLAPGK